MPLRDSSDQVSQQKLTHSVSQGEIDSQHQCSSAAAAQIPASREHEPAESDEPLVDLKIEGSGRALTHAAQQLLSDGRSRFKTVHVFDFVPCNYEIFWDILDAQPRGTFCEYGSGFGIATGLAELLGFDSLGIELSPDLAAASRDLLASQGLKARIELGDYLQRRDMADIYFTYAWPSRMRLIERHFFKIAKPHTKLLYCHGQDDIRCKVLRSSVASTHA